MTDQSAIRNPQSAIRFTPGQAITWRARQGFWLDDKPFFPVGTNYVASYVCTNYWEDWRPDEITADLDRIAALGLNALRIPIHWEYAEPAPGQFRPEMFARLGQFLSWAEARGLAVMPWFLIGVATQFYDVSWREKRSFFTEPMLGHAANHIRTFVERFKDRPNILCWDLCDEPEFYAQMPGGDPIPYNEEIFKHWVAQLYQAAKQADPIHAVMMGFGHLITNHYGMHPREMERILDMMGVTGYTHDGDMEALHSFRNTYFLPWYLRMNDTQGRGTFANEAPGWSTVIVSEESLGLHYRLVLHSMLAAESWGILPWVWNDFRPEIWEQSPLDTAVFEPGFGLCRVDGTIKPSGKELGAFARHVKEYPPREWPLAGPEACILIPAGYFSDVELHFRTMFVAFMVARQAGLRVRFVWEADWAEAAKDCKLLILPGCPSGLTIGSWQRIEAWVAGGGTLCCSQGFARLVYPGFNKLFGVTLQGSATAPGGIQWETAPKTPPELAPHAAFPPARIRMVVSAAGAEVWAASDTGEPLLLFHEFGAGRALLLAYSAEQSMATMESSKFATHPLHTVYRLAAARAGLTPPLQGSDPRLEVSTRVHASDPSEWLATLINHSMDSYEASVRAEGPIQIEQVVQSSGPGMCVENALRVQMKPAEVRIVRLKRG